MTHPIDRPKSCWSIILAGGNGERTRPFIEQWLGSPRPKQFCSFVGTRSLLQHTWDRADQVTLPNHKVTVMAQDHHQQVWSELGDHREGKVILQPQNKDTGAGIFLPLTYVRKWNPEGTIILHPADHFVFPEERFVEALKRMVSATDQFPNRAILLGVPPTDLEQEYGWIQPGWTLGWSGGSCVKEVSQFVEKPSLPTAESFVASGGLWNTLILAAKVKTLWQLGWKCLPQMMGYFEELYLAIGTPREGLILQAIYHCLPSCNFSQDLLEHSPDRLGLMVLRNVLWSDWGHPERIAATLQEIGKEPNFPSHCLTENRGQRKALTHCEGVGS